MRDCYLCGRESKGYCSECQRPVCKIHLEEELKTSQITILCSACLRKRKLKRLRLFVLIFAAVLILLIVGAIVFTSLKLFN